MSSIDAATGGCQENTSSSGQHAGACACCVDLASVRWPAILQQPAAANAQPAAKEPAAAAPADAVETRKKKKKKGAASDLLARLTRPKRKSDHLDDIDGVPVPKPMPVWDGIDGALITVFGMVLPLLTLAFMCISVPKRITLVLLNHPLETTIEIAMLASAPLINYVVWSAIRKLRLRFARAAAAAVGFAAGTFSFVAALAITCALTCEKAFLQYGESMDTGLLWLAVLSIFAAAASAFIIHKIRKTHDFDSSRKQLLACALSTMLLPAVFFCAAEVKSFVIRHAEVEAVSGSGKTAAAALAWLRFVNPERELRMESADDRAAGLSGLFLPLKQSSQRNLYFALTGKPSSFRDYKNTDLTSLPDDYLTRNVVGDAVPGLSLTRSTLSGAVHARSLTATMNWTFVFKNDSAGAQEARAELGLPPGAVLNKLAAYIDGEPEEAAIIPADGSRSWGQPNDTIGHDATCVAADLGRGRLLLHCYPVPPEHESMIKLSVVVPLSPQSDQTASIPLPKIIASNFELAGKHLLKMSGDQPIWQTGSNAGGATVFQRQLSADDIHAARWALTISHPQSPVLFAYDGTATHIAQQEAKEAARAERERRKREEQEEREEEGNQQYFVVVDASHDVGSQLASVAGQLNSRHKRHKIEVKPVNKQYVIDTVERVSAAAPERLEVVVDGSVGTREYIEQFKRALAKIPASVPTQLRIASQQEGVSDAAVPLREALADMDRQIFIGGQNNLQSIIEAAQDAGASDNGAVLWIHGPQPASNQEIYIMEPYHAHPSFYEMTLGTAEVDTVEYFKNHGQIGPFLHVPAVGNVEADLTSFFDRWKPDTNRYALELQQTEIVPAGALEATPGESEELLTLHAERYFRSLVADKNASRATKIATEYGFVSARTLALVDTHRAFAHPMSSARHNCKERPMAQSGRKALTPR
jgi:hypothetical protein